MADLNFNEEWLRKALLRDIPSMPSKSDNNTAISAKQIDSMFNRTGGSIPGLGVLKPELLPKPKPDIVGQILERAKADILKKQSERKKLEEELNKPIDKTYEKPAPKLRREKPKSSFAQLPAKTDIKTKEIAEPTVTELSEAEKTVSAIKQSLNEPKESIKLPATETPERRSIGDYIEEFRSLYKEPTSPSYTNDELVAMAIMGLGMPLALGLAGASSGDYSLGSAAGKGGLAGISNIYDTKQRLAEQSIAREKDLIDLASKLYGTDVATDKTLSVLDTKLSSALALQEAKGEKARAEQLIKLAELESRMGETSGELGVKKKQLGLAEQKQKFEEEYKKQYLDYLKSKINKGASSPAQKALDAAFAKQYVEDLTNDVFGNSLAGMNDLKNVLIKLREKPQLVGKPFKSLLPLKARALLSSEERESVDLQQAVERIVQRQLRPLLGQFTAAEAEGLISRSFNPALPAEENIKRVSALLAATQWAYEQKLKAHRYFEENSTMAGYKGLTDVNKNVFFNKLKEFESLARSPEAKETKSRKLSDEERRRIIEKLKQQRGF